MARSHQWATTPARRRQILDAALECFDAKGVAATTVEDICAAAGLSVGSIYHHFSGRDDILGHLVAEALSEYRAGFVAALEGGSDLKSSLRRIVRFHVGWVERRPMLTKLMLRVEESARDSPDGRQQFDEYNEAIGAWLRRQVRAGAIRRMEPALYAALLLGPLLEHARLRAAGITAGTTATFERGLVEGLYRVLAPRGASGP